MPATPLIKHCSEKAALNKQSSGFSSVNGTYRWPQLWRGVAQLQQLLRIDTSAARRCIRTVCRLDVSVTKGLDAGRLWLSKSFVSHTFDLGRTSSRSAVAGVLGIAPHDLHPVSGRHRHRLGVGRLLSVHSAKADAQTDTPATFVGAEACAGCHAPETERWKTSHHALAMQKASAATVLGDFANATLTHHGVTTIFSRDGEKFMVRTEGPDGAPHDYEIAYTFGVSPLQQYLIAFPGGRYQALGIAWDSRPKDQGGQRWFPLYPGQILRSRRQPPLDRTRPDLELSVRELPFHGFEEELRPRRRQLRHQLDRCRRRLRGLPRPGLPPRRLGRGASGRKLWTIAGGAKSSAGDRPDGAHDTARAGQPRPMANEPRDGHRTARRAIELTGARRLRRMPFPPQGDRKGSPRRRGFPRCLSARAA